MCHIGMQEHAHHFLAGFKPCLAFRINSQLKAKLPDYCPLDPYRVEDIYNATLYTLQYKTCMPFVPLLHNILLPGMSFQDMLPSFQILLHAVPLFLPTLEQPLLVKVTPFTPVQVHPHHQAAPLSLLPRSTFLPLTPT